MWGFEKIPLVVVESQEYPKLGAREPSRGEKNRSGAGIQPARVHEELEQKTAGELEHSGEHVSRTEPWREQLVFTLAPSHAANHLSHCRL